jgi:hypothetical protein
VACGPFALWHWSRRIKSGMNRICRPWTLFGTIGLQCSNSSKMTASTGHKSHFEQTIGFGLYRGESTRTATTTIMQRDKQASERMRVSPNNVTSIFVHRGHNDRIQLNTGRKR